MATINAISVALFNAAAGGYSAEMTANGAAFANAVGPVLEKDISTDALFVEHLLGNLGVTSTSAVYAQAKAAVAGLVTAKGRLGATVDAVDFLKAQEGSTSAYASIAADFAAKVNKAALFTAANATERDITKLVSAITGVDTDAAAISAAAAAATAAAEAKAAAAAISAATAAAAAAATAAAEAKAAAEKVAADAAAAAKTAADAAAATAAATAKAAAEKVAADAAAAAKTAADAAAATAAATAAAEAKAAAEKVAADAAAAAKTAADAAAATAAATAAAEAKAAAEKVAADAAAAAKTAADAAAATAAAEAKAAADAAATKAAADLAAVDNTTYASEQAALDAANAAAATAAAAAKAEADAAATKAAADLAAANATITSLKNPAGEATALTTDTDIAFGVSGGNDSFTATDLTFNTEDLIVDGNGTDKDTLTLNVVTKGVNSISATPVVAGFENFVVNFAGFGTATLDATNIRGAAITVNQTQTGGSTAATVNSVGTGLTVSTGSTITGTVTIDGVDAGDITLNTAGTTIVVADGGTLDDVTITSTGGSSSTAVGVDTDADGDLNVTASATGDLNIDAVAATTVVATNTAGAINARTGGSGDDLTAATSITLTAKDEIIIDTKAAKSVTLSAGGTTTDSSVIDNGDVLVTANLSGNGAAVDFDLTGADKVSTINFTGSQNVRAIVSAADIDGLTGDKLTITDKSTGTSTLQLGTAVGNAVLTSAVVDVVDLAIDNKGKAITLASGQTLLVSTDQTSAGTTTIDGADASASTNELTINLYDGDSTDSGAVDLDVVTFTDLNAVVINANIDTKVASRLDTLDGSADNTSITINAGSKGLTIEGTNTIGTGALVVNSSGAVTMSSVGLTAGSFTSSGAGAVTWDNIDSDTTASVTTDSGKDALTLVGSGTSVSISTGSGDDTVTISNKGDATAERSISIDMGAGTLDTVVFADKADMTATGASFTMTNVERLDFDGAVTIGAAAVTGKSYIVKNTATAEAVVTVELATATRTVDLSSLEIDTASITAANDRFVITGSGSNSLTLTGATAAVNYITGGDSDDLITGGLEADQLTGGKGGDSFVAGEGKDGVYGGAGADVIDLTESSSVADVIVIAAIDNGSAVGAAGGTFSNYDTIVGFKAGTDKLVFDSGTVDFNTTVATAIVDTKETAQLKAGTAATAAVNDITLSNYTSVDQVVNFIADAGTSLSFTASKTNLLAVTLGTGTSGTTVIYGIVNDATAAVAATEIYLIGTVNGVLTLADDFVYA
jgi:hypothetical protein